MSKLNADKIDEQRVKLLSNLWLLSVIKSVKKIQKRININKGLNGKLKR